MIQKYALLVLFFGILVDLNAQTTILSEDFQSGFPANWLLIDVDQQTPNAVVSEYTEAWILKTDPEDATNTVISSTSYFEPEGQANKWLITEAVTLGAFGNKLTWKAKAHDPAYADGYKVLVSKTGTNISDFTDTITLVLSENSEWETRNVDLSELGYNNQTVHFAFVNTTNQGYKLYIDDIQVSKEDAAATFELSEINVSVYPNPFQEQIFVKTDEKIMRLVVVDLLGKVVFEAKNPIGNSISLAVLENGNYFLQIESEKGLKVVQISKK